MKPHEDVREESRADQPTDDLHPIETMWRAIVNHLNPYDLDEDRTSEGTT